MAGSVLRIKLFRKFERSCFVSKVVLKIRSLAKPRTVVKVYKRTHIMFSTRFPHSYLRGFTSFIGAKRRLNRIFA